MWLENLFEYKGILADFIVSRQDLTNL